MAEGDTIGLHLAQHRSTHSLYLTDSHLKQVETSMALPSPISVRHFMVTFLNAATCRNYSDRVSYNAITAAHAHTDIQMQTHIRTHAH